MATQDKITLEARVIYVRHDKGIFIEDSDRTEGYAYEFWIETPYGNLLGRGSSMDNAVRREVGEIVNCEIVEYAIPPDYEGLKNECTNWYKIL